jgi:hypothetical protein
MATILKIKRSTSSGTSAPTSLSAGELAISYGTGTAGNAGQRLFVGDHDGNDVLVSSLINRKFCCTCRFK